MTPLSNLPAVLERPTAIQLPIGYSFSQEQPDADSIAVPLSHYFWILRRHLWKMIAFVIFGVSATAIVSSRLTPIYQSTATVDVDRRAPTGVLGQESQVAAVSDSDQFLATQIKLIQSDSVLRPIVRKYQPEKTVESAQDQQVPLAALEDAPVLLKNLKVTRPANTYLLLIAYRHPNPRMAAEVANSVAQSYIQHTYDLRVIASMGLASFMEKQLEGLKAKMERSSTAVATFERELNVINPEEKTSILSTRLQQFNADYPAAASCTSAVFAARLLGIGRILYFVNNTAVRYTSFLRWPDYLFDRLVARWVTLFITGSTYNATALSRVLRLPLGKVVNIPTGVATAHSGNANSLRESLGVEDARCVVAVAAVLEKRKGHVYLLRALDLMRRRGMQPLPLVIVIGGGSQKAFLQGYAEGLGLQDIVRFLGAKEHAACLDLIEASDVLVLPSVSNEDWPNAVMEAMSLGKPVVGTRVAGIPEQIEDGITGFLVAPRDEAGLADALQRLAENSTLRRSLGQAGAEKCRREFAHAVVMSRYRRLYGELFEQENRSLQAMTAPLV